MFDPLFWTYLFRPIYLVCRTTFRMEWGGYNHRCDKQQPNNYPIIEPLHIFGWTYWTLWNLKICHMWTRRKHKYLKKNIFKLDLCFLKKKILIAMSLILKFCSALASMRRVSKDISPQWLWRRRRELPELHFPNVTFMLFWYSFGHDKAFSFLFSPYLSLIILQFCLA